MLVAVHNSGTPVQHTCRAGTLSLKAGSWSHHQPPVPSTKARQTDCLWSDSRAGPVGNRTDRDTDETPAWYVHSNNNNNNNVHKCNLLLLAGCGNFQKSYFVFHFKPFNRIS